MRGGVVVGSGCRRTAPDCARRGPPPPAPPPSFLGERGEFDSASAGIGLRPRGAPPPAPPRSFLAERGEFDPAATRFLPFSLPHAVCGGGPGRGRPTIPLHAICHHTLSTSS